MLLPCYRVVVSAGPSPQWLFEQIHALPGSDKDHVTDELHAKKSEIPEHKKRKDGVKRLFNFLDSAIKDSGSGSGEGSATEEHSGSTGLTENQVTKNEGPEQQEKTKSPDSAKQITNQHSSNEHQATATKAQTRLPIYHQGGAKRLPGLSGQSINHYTTADQQGQQMAYYAPQRTVAYSAYTGPRTAKTQTTCK